MAKPRVIIADRDESYIIPLQLKFVEDFFEKVELEIITEERYFNELFATPQHVDILIVSEELYKSEIKRHNISHIFMMTEQYEDGMTTDLSINHIFKYTSIKEIFNEIINKSSDILCFNTESKKETQIVVVCSACGGVGKTTVALGVSASLTKNYKRVLYINAARLQSFQHVLENPTPIAPLDLYSKLMSLPENVYLDMKYVIRKELFSYVPPFKAALASLGIPYGVYEKIALGAKASEEYDFVVVDVESSFDADVAKLMQIADKVVVVTEQTATSVYATNVMVSNVAGMSGEKYVFVCNNFDKNANNALISPQMTPRFVVSEYINHFNYYDQVKYTDFSDEIGIQKTTFLVM